jgi:hypothetical protein
MARLYSGLKLQCVAIKEGLSLGLPFVMTHTWVVGGTCFRILGLSALLE